jgi:tetratricopeptide (TPR) repeat protein
MIIKKAFFLFLVTILFVSLYSQEKKGINPNEISSFSDEDISGIDLNKQHALIIGINKYDYIRDLHNAEQDSKKIVDLLIQKFGYKIENIKTLYDRDADSVEIQNMLDFYTSELEPKDSLFIYFSGHGHKTEIPEKGYWIPSNVGADLNDTARRYRKNDENDNNEVMRLSRVKFAHYDIMRFMETCKANHIFVVADSCHSAIFFKEFKGKPDDVVPSEELLDRKSRQLLAAGDYSVSDGIRGKSSPFARLFIDILKKSSFKNGFVSATKIISDIEYSFKSLKDKSKGNIQIPKGGRVFDSGDEHGEFYFFLKTRVFIEQMKIDYKSLTEDLDKEVGSLDERIKRCGGFLDKYNKISRVIPNAYSKEAVKMHAAIVKRRNELKRSNIDVLRYKNLGDENFKKGNYVEAGGCFEKILKKLPNDPYAEEKIYECKSSQYKKSAALKYFEKGQYDKAYIYFNELIKISPLDEEVNEKLRNIISKQGDEFFNNKEYKKAITKYEEALALAPDNKELIEKIKKSKELKQKKEIKEKMENLKNKADTFFENGNYKEALKLYNQILNELKDESSIRIKIKKCEEEIDFNDIVNERAALTFEIYLRFYKKYPNSTHLSELQIYLKENDLFLPPVKYWHGAIMKNNKGYYEYTFDKAHNGHIMIYIPEKRFWIDKYEVSNRQFNEFLEQEGLKIETGIVNKYRKQDDEYPAATGYKYAQKYCKGYGFRLPKESEWEYAAGKGRFLYPWGDESPDYHGIYRANYDTLENDIEKDGFPGTAPVKSFEKFSSPFGVVNMAGNVWEWVQKRILKGGCFISGKENMTIKQQVKGKKEFKKGFRCIMDE